MAAVRVEGGRDRLLDAEGGSSSRLADPSSQEASTPRSEGFAPPLVEPDANPVSFGQLFRFATRRDRFLLVLGALGATFQGLSGPAMALFLKDLFTAIFLPNDDGSMPPHATGDHYNRDEKVWHSCMTMLGLATLTFCAGGLNYIGLAHVADNMTLRLKEKFFDQLLQKDVGWYDLHSTAEMSTRLTNDCYDFRQGVGEKLGTLMMGLLMVPAGFAVAFSHDWRLTLMMLIAVPFMALNFSVSFKLMSGAAKAQQERNAKAGGFAETSLAAIRTVAAFSGFDREVARYNEEMVSSEKEGIRAGMCNALTFGLFTTTMYATFTLGFFAGSILVIRDYNNNCWQSDPPFGTCFTGATMMSTIFAVLNGGMGMGVAAPGMATLTAAKAAAGRIYAIIDAAPAFDADVGEKLEKVEGKVEFKDVLFYYPSRPEVPALRASSFVVHPGKRAAFVGPSGSGKSTTIALLQRFYDPASGCILVDGKDIRTLSLTSLRQKMALVQQEPVLFSGTIFDNIAYGLPGQASQRAIESAAEAANAHKFIQNFPKRYQTEVGERGTQLSGGQKQRIAIARAIVRDPAILLLDEATSSLDNESERVVQKALDDLLAQKARTTLVIAHRLSTIKDAHTIFVMDDGHIVQQGTHKELMAEKDSLYVQLVELQEVAGAEDAPAGILQRQASNSLPGRTSSGVLGRRQSSNLQQRHHSGHSGPGQVNSFTSGTSRTPPPSPGVTIAQQWSRTVSGRHASHTSETSQSGRPEEVFTPEHEVPPEDDEEVKVPLRRLWLMQRPDWPIIGVALVSTMVYGACRPFMGYFFSDVTTLFSRPPAILIPPGIWVGIMDTEEVRREANKKCLMFAILGVGMVISLVIQQGGFRRSAETLTKRIRVLTFRAMLRQEISWFDERSSGHLADRLATEAPLIKSFTGESMASSLQMVFCMISGLAIAVKSSWRLTLFNALFVPLLLSFSAIMAMKIKAAAEIKSKTGPIVTEAMGNIRSVAAFGLKKKILKKYMDELHEEGRRERSTSMITAVTNSYNSSVQFLLFSGIIYASNIFINRSLAEPASVLKVLFPIMFAASGMSMASQWHADKVKAKSALNHIFNTLDRIPLIDAYATTGDKLDKVRGEIEYRHVAFRYPTRPDISVFEDFDLKIKAGTTVAFCGPSGSGKSTTISLLQRFYSPTSGSILLDGRDISTLNIDWLRKRMAFVQQEPILFAGTILQNIAYGREGAKDEECKLAAKAANAHNFIMNFPDGYNAEVGERGAQLSGGQKQRVAIARSMVRDPAVLLLDEATSALDSESERIVQEALDALLAQSQRTTLVIAHRLSTIVNADLICVIYQGKIVEKGKHSELMEIKDGHYKRLAQRQQH